MNELIGFISAVVVFFILIILVVIYLTFKIIQFIIVAVNLYKEMIQNQKRIIEILKLNDKDNKTAEIFDDLICPKCKKPNERDNKFCENCGTILVSNAQ